MEMTRGEIQDLLTKFTAESEKYREALKEDPKGIIAKQFGMSIPDHVQIKVLEETADTVYVVLPHVVKEGEELSDADLEAVAGGHTIVKDAKCSGGNVNTVISMEASLGL